MFNRLNRVLQGALDPDKVGKMEGRQPTIESLLPGDVLSLWDEGDSVVQDVLECHEELNGRETRWRWNLLDEGRMVEVAPDGNVLYTRSEVLTQDTAGFEALTADVEHGGVLRAFEARVQEGTAARNPTLFEHRGKTFRVVSTGVFGARPAGSGQLPRAAVWRDIDPMNPGNNVYFELDPTEEGEDGESIVLGVWTTHVALLFGRPIKSADIQSIYPRLESPTTRV